MIHGLLAGILWGLDTVILGIALSLSPFTSTKTAVILAPFVSTFLHDACSSLWMLFYMAIRRQLGNVWRALRTKSGRFIILGAALGGPIGMSGYVAAIRLIGPSYTAILSAFFPALGALLSRIFLKEHMNRIQITGLFISILGIIGLGLTPESGSFSSSWLIGFLAALLCVFGWSSEAVICAYGMQDPNITNEHALFIRQFTSALFYGILILPFISGWNFAVSILSEPAFLSILVSALFGTGSYLFYYGAIHKIGPAKAMALDVTYSAWSMIFSFLLQHTIPDIKSILCGILVICGSLVAANGFPMGIPARKSDSLN